MSKDISENLQSVSEAEQNNLRMLVTIFLDSTTYYLCEGETSDVIFNGQTYIATNISRSDISTNMNGDLERLTLTIEDYNSIVASFIALNGNEINNRRCLIQEVDIDYLNDPNDIITVFDGVMDNLRMNIGKYQVDVKRTLGTHNSHAPVMTYSPMCQWKKFKDDYCAYAGAETKCDRTLTRCKELSNETNFGGHPSIPFEMQIKID